MKNRNKARISRLNTVPPFPLAVATNAVGQILGGDAVVYSLGSNGVCRLAELDMMASCHMPPQAPLYVATTFLKIPAPDCLDPAINEETRTNIALYPAPKTPDEMRGIVDRSAMPALLVFAYSVFDDLFQGMEQKPQRVWPMVHMATGCLGFFDRGASFHAATLKETLACANIG